MTKQIKTCKIVRIWTNFFASTGYQLEDGTIIYVNYDQTEMTIQKVGA